MMLTLSPLRALHEINWGEGEAPKSMIIFSNIPPPPLILIFYRTTQQCSFFKNGPPCTIFVVYYATYMNNHLKKGSASFYLNSSIHMSFSLSAIVMCLLSLLNKMVDTVDVLKVGDLARILCPDSHWQRAYHA